MVWPERSSQDDAWEVGFLDACCRHSESLHNQAIIFGGLCNDGLW